MRKKILFGSGQAAINFLSQFNTENIEYIIDNNSAKWGTTVGNLTIYNPQKLMEESNVLVIVASTFYDEISNQLSNQYNLLEGVDYVYYELYFPNLGKESKDIVYPKVVNYPITNKCNFRCAMCNVWKPAYAAHKDLTPVEIGQLFRKPLFKELTHVGISGGEPFVRADLEQAIEEIVKNTPSLKSISIITNCSMKNTVERVHQIKKFLSEHGIAFSLQVSIDGVGEIHDINRGKKGAFNLMYANFEQLNKLGLITEISTTITKNNINHLWENYMFARKHNVYIRYRIATQISRLYNEDLIDNYTFNRQERLFLIKFFENLCANYEKRLDKKINYYSVINILNGGNRISGCHYQTSEGISLDPYGNMHFCFPNSEKITNINDEIDYDIEVLEQHKDKLTRAKKHCQSCIHDYNGPYTSEGSKYFLNTLSGFKKEYLLLNNYLTEYRFKRGECVE